jgi:hypothetical protein
MSILDDEWSLGVIILNDKNQNNSTCHNHLCGSIWVCHTTGPSKGNSRLE